MLSILTASVAFASPQHLSVQENAMALARLLASSPAFRKEVDGETIIDNQIGFSFASLSIGSESGEDSTIAGSRARIAATAELLATFPDSRLLIEGHVGVSAPPEIADQFSEHRANVVSQILEEDYNVSASRIASNVGWGYRISQLAQGSPHPLARAAKEGFGWAELYFVFGSCHDGAMVPARPSFYFRPSPPDEEMQREELAAPSPPPAPRSRPTSHPIFYMAPGASVGDALALHFFEPRYKLLIQRALATDKTFIFCARAPMSAAARDTYNLPLGEEPADDGCVSVVVDRVEVSDDGEADVWGHATAAVTLHDVQLEPGTGGLFSTTSLAAQLGYLTPPSEVPSRLAEADAAEKSAADDEVALEVLDAVDQQQPSAPHMHFPCPMLLARVALLLVFGALLCRLVCGHCGRRAPAQMVAVVPPGPFGTEPLISSEIKICNVVKV